MIPMCRQVQHSDDGCCSSQSMLGTQVDQGENFIVQAQQSAAEAAAAAEAVAAAHAAAVAAQEAAAAEKAAAAKAAKVEKAERQAAAKVRAAPAIPGMLAGWSLNCLVYIADLSVTSSFFGVEGMAMRSKTCVHNQDQCTAHSSGGS